MEGDNHVINHLLDALIEPKGRCFPKATPDGRFVFNGEIVVVKKPAFDFAKIQILLENPIALLRVLLLWFENAYQENYYILDSIIRKDQYNDRPLELWFDAILPEYRYPYDQYFGRYLTYIYLITEYYEAGLLNYDGSLVGDSKFKNYRVYKPYKHVWVDILIRALQHFLGSGSFQFRKAAVSPIAALIEPEREIFRCKMLSMKIPSVDPLFRKLESFIWLFTTNVKVSEIIAIEKYIRSVNLEPFPGLFDYYSCHVNIHFKIHEALTGVTNVNGCSTCFLAQQGCNPCKRQHCTNCGQRTGAVVAKRGVNNCINCPYNPDPNFVKKK